MSSDQLAAYLTCRPARDGYGLSVVVSCQLLAFGLLIVGRRLTLMNADKKNELSMTSIRAIFLLFVS